MRQAAKLLLAMACAGLAPSLAHGQDSPELKRGAYLATIMDCGGCHTEGALAGQPDPSLTLAGSSIGFEIPGLGYFYPPNLTPDRETGLGSWSEADIIKAVRTGIRPDGRELVGIMAWRSYAALSDADALALARYLKSLKPVHRAPPPPTGIGEKPPSAYFTVVVPK